MSSLTDYCILYEDPDRPALPVCIVTPTDEFMQQAYNGELMSIDIWLDLMRDENKAIAEGRHRTFEHDPEKLRLQKEGKRAGKLTEEEAITYLIFKDVPESVWGRKHNRTMLKVMKRQNLPKTRTFRNAWEIRQ